MQPTVHKFTLLKQEIETIPVSSQEPFHRYRGAAGFFTLTQFILRIKTPAGRPLLPTARAGCGGMALASTIPDAARRRAVATGMMAGKVAEGAAEVCSAQTPVARAIAPVNDEIPFMHEKSPPTRSDPAKLTGHCRAIVGILPTIVIN